MFGTQHGQVLGEVGRFNREVDQQRTGAHLAFPQGFHDGDPGRVGEGLEDLRLEDAKRRVHRPIMFYISKYRN